LPEEQNIKLVVDGKIRQDVEGAWCFRKIEGWVSKDPANPNNGQHEKVLIVWRKLIGDLGKDNLPNLQQEGDIWKVRLTEEEFMKRMWDVKV